MNPNQLITVEEYLIGSDSSSKCIRNRCWNCSKEKTFFLSYTTAFPFVLLVHKRLKRLRFRILFFPVILFFFFIFVQMFVSIWNVFLCILFDSDQGMLKKCIKTNEMGQKKHWFLIFSRFWIQKALKITYPTSVRSSANQMSVCKKER